MTRNTRDRIRAIVVQFPGLHLREIARQMDISLALVQYHIPRLVEDGVLELEEQDGMQRVYPVKIQQRRGALAALREPHRLHLCLVLLDAGPQRHGDLAQATGLSKSTVSFHLKRLEKARLIERDGPAYRLVDPEATRRLIAEHKPTPDVIDKFAKMWGDLYG